MEFYNVVKTMIGHVVNNANEAKNTAIYVFGFSKKKRQEESTTIIGQYTPTSLVINHKFKDDIGFTTKAVLKEPKIKEEKKKVVKKGKPIIGKK